MTDSTTSNLYNMMKMAEREAISNSTRIAALEIKMGILNTDEKLRLNAIKDRIKENLSNYKTPRDLLAAITNEIVTLKEDEIVTLRGLGFNLLLGTGELSVNDTNNDIKVLAPVGFLIYCTLSDDSLIESVNFNEGLQEVLEQ